MFSLLTKRVKITCVEQTVKWRKVEKFAIFKHTYTVHHLNYGLSTQPIAILKQARSRQQRYFSSANNYLDYKLYLQFLAKMRRFFHSVSIFQFVYQVEYF